MRAGYAHPQPPILVRLGTMLHRLFPHANESLASLAEISAQVGEAAALLSEMVGSPVAEYPELFERMLTHEADSTNLLFRTLTEVRSSFSPPIPREDLYTLARKLTNAVEKLTSAAHVLSLHSIDGFATHITSILDIIQRQAVLTAAVIPKLADIRGLDNYWMDMLRISRQALRTAEEYNAYIAERYTPERYRRYATFLAQLTAASNAMRDVSAEIGRIIVQES